MIRRDFNGSGCGERAASLWLLAALAGALLGCGGKAADTTTVSGKITYNSKPLSGGMINFLATGKQPLGGGLKPGGAYQYELPPGDYQVIIETPPQMPPGYKEGDPVPNLPRELPEKFANYNTSGLKATVVSGATQTIDFKLE